MRAIDTNIVLRILLEDDPIQTPIAMRLLEEPALVETGVLMETALVFGSTYGMPREQIADALSSFIDIPTVTVRDIDGVRWAIERYRDHRADIADMLHIVSARGSSGFASFEKRLAERAGPATPMPIELPS